MNNVEIELRYEVLNPVQLDTFLVPFKKLGQKRQVDAYLDNPAHELWRRGIFVRVRNDKTLDIKFNRECLLDPTLVHQDYCEEHRFELPLQDRDLEKLNALLVSLDLAPAPSADVELFKKINNLSTHYTVDKTRTSYEHENFRLCVDQVAHVGLFLEIELMADSIEHVQTVKKQMIEFLRPLALEPVKIGYCSIAVRRQCGAEYCLGRFIPQEDMATV